MPKPTWTRKEFEDAVASSVTVADICRKLSLSVTNGNYRTVKRYVAKFGLSTEHITGRPSRPPANKRLLKDILVRDSTYTSSRLKKRVIAAGILREECAECGLGAEWNGRPLVLRLDHINGDFQDHRKENLRVLCPNCDSQSKTYLGRNIRKRSIPKKVLRRKKRRPKKQQKLCSQCNGKATRSRSTGLCKKCYLQRDRPEQRRFNLGREELMRLVWEMPIRDLAQRLGVSDAAVHKRCRKLDIEKPPRGYWIRK